MNMVNGINTPPQPEPGIKASNLHSVRIDSDRVKGVVSPKPPAEPSIETSVAVRRKG